MTKLDSSLLSSCLAVCLLVSGCGTSEQSQRRVNLDPARAILAPDDGWAASGRGTTGGSDALPGDIFEVHTRLDLIAALSPGNRPRIIKIYAQIDLSTDRQGKSLGFDDYRDPAFDFEAYLRAYDPLVWGKRTVEGPLEDARIRSARRQAQQVVVRVPSNTTLIGAGPGAGFKHGTLLLDKVENVIIRNLIFSDSYDYFPAWEPSDNEHGEWNSAYDGVTLIGATHVWIDHCTFNDGDRPDHLARFALGRRIQHHDGLLDITQQSNLITVSWNHFHDHDKTTLVGSSDNRVLDASKLKVTFHHNFYENVKERSPRVRFGQVHVYNNLYSGRNEGTYSFGYSVGIGINSLIYSEGNAWETSAGIGPGRLTRLLKGARFYDQDSTHNGQSVDLLKALHAANPGASVSGDVGWRPLLHGLIDRPDAVSAKVRAGAGASR